MKTLSVTDDPLNNQSLFTAFLTQLAKDFEQSNFPTSFIHKLPANFFAIRAEIAKELRAAETRTDSRLMNLLYRVDISDAQLARYLHEAGAADHLTTIAELIIKRVLQKVVLRKYYAGK